MSAAEIIEHIKALPSSERTKVVAFVHSVEASEIPPNEGVRTMEPLVFARAKAAVFKKHDEVLRRLAQ